MQFPRLRPESPLLWCWGSWALLSFGASWWPVWEFLWLGFGFFLLVLSLVDLFRLFATPSPILQRKLSTALSLGCWAPVRLLLENPHVQPLRLWIHDLHPEDFQVRALPQYLRLPPQSLGEVRYEVRPSARGDARFTGCELRLLSPWGCWSHTRALAHPTPVRIFPNFLAIHHYQLLAQAQRLGKLGIRRLRQGGGGGEFHQLREYRQGDSLRQIDWKATARMRKLIAREYEEERDQRLYFLLDCGRYMGHRSEESGHLDEALNALLLLAAIALQQGDEVGLMTYGGVRRSCAPRKDAAALRRLLARVYDLQPSLAASDPLEAVQALLPRLKRRALVIFLTNSRDEENPDLYQAVRLLAKRHLVILADLREAFLDETLQGEIRTLEQALRFYGVQAYFEARRRHHERLRHSGAQVLDLLPKQLAPALVNRYLEIKTKGTL